MEYISKKIQCTSEKEINVCDRKYMKSEVPFWSVIIIL